MQMFIRTAERKAVQQLKLLNMAVKELTGTELDIVGCQPDDSDLSICSRC